MNEENFVKATSGQVVKLEETGSALTGHFVGIEESALYGDSYAFHVRDETGSIYTTFVSHIVKDLVEKNNIKPNMKIKLVFTGRVKAKASGKVYKQYELFYVK